MGAEVAAYLMTPTLASSILIWLSLTALLPGGAMGDEFQAIALPPPQMEGGKPLLDAVFIRDARGVYYLSEILWTLIPS
jgi:hypothetical protein